MIKKKVKLIAGIASDWMQARISAEIKVEDLDDI